MSDTATPPRATVRAARAEDLDSIEALLASSSLPTVGVREALPRFVVADSNGEIVGVAGLEPCGGSALLRSVAVKPEWRSAGVGRALVTRAIADAEASGTDALYLLTTTAERYFPGFGFREIARDAVPESVRATAEFRDACPASATVMIRRA